MSDLEKMRMQFELEKLRLEIELAKAKKEEHVDKIHKRLPTEPIGIEKIKLFLNSSVCDTPPIKLLQKQIKQIPSFQRPVAWDRKKNFYLFREGKWIKNNEAADHINNLLDSYRKELTGHWIDNYGDESPYSTKTDEGIKYMMSVTTEPFTYDSFQEGLITECTV